MRQAGQQEVREQVEKLRNLNENITAQCLEENQGIGVNKLFINHNHKIERQNINAKQGCGKYFRVEPKYVNLLRNLRGKL